MSKNVEKNFDIATTDPSPNLPTILDSKAETRLLRKLDIVIIPLATLLYLSAYLDRGNLGNAKIIGLMDVLGESSTAYSLALSFFFIPYILLSIPGTLAAKVFMPSHSIAAGALIWSIGACCQAAVNNPGGLYICRILVGIGEAFFGQAMALYFTIWYKRNEVAKRVGFFISAGAVSGAFGGLIAFGVSSIHKPKIDAWRILFLIEGCPSLVLAIVVFFCLPTRPETSKYLKESERDLLIARLAPEKDRTNQIAIQPGQGLKQRLNDRINWHGVQRGFTCGWTIVSAIAYSCLNLCLGSVSGFLPTIIKDLGYTAAKAQLMSVPPYVVALVVMLLVTSYSDRKLTRGIPAACIFCVGIVGWAILLAVPAKNPVPTDLHARYFGIICITTAGYCNIPLMISWVGNNCKDESMRAVGLGLMNSVGQCLSILAAFLFPKQEGPKFVKGAAVNIAFQALGLVIVLSLTTYFRWYNAKKDREEGNVNDLDMSPEEKEFESTKFDRAKGFRFVC